MICDVMAAEVSELCGPKYHPEQGEHFRAGTSAGRILVDGEREGSLAASRGSGQKQTRPHAGWHLR